MTRARPGSGRLTGLGALFALLALAMNILSPPGFMTASGRDGPTVVICTGHGPAPLSGAGAGGDGERQSGHHSGQGGVCAFAGHGLAAAPPPLGMVGVAAFAPAAPAVLAFADLAPGRGLAAPPPPSRGPPRLT